MNTSVVASPHCPLWMCRGTTPWVLWLALILTACPQSSSTPSATARAACEYIARCASWQLRLYPGGSVEGCAEFQDVLLGAQGSSECAATIAALECEDTLPPRGATLPECAYDRAERAPRVGEGEACWEAWCDEGLWCSIEGVAPACDRRVCRPRPHEGEACGPAPCDLDLRCHPDQGVCVRPGRLGETCPRVGCEAPLTCIEETCSHRREAGQPCFDDHDCAGVCDDAGHCAERTYAAVGASCDERSCEPGLLCRDGRCRTWGDVGEACRAGDVPEAPELLGFSVAHDCRLGLACVEGRCERTMPGVATAGQACDRAVTRCAEGLYCGYEGRCEALPTPQLGEACNPRMVEDFGFVTCVEGYCDRETERCVLGAAEGEPCGVERCRDPLTCVEGVCQSPKVDGEACESSQECGLFASCDPKSRVCRCGF